MSEKQRVIDAFTEMAPHYEETIDRELRQFWGVSYAAFIEMLLDHLDLGCAGAVLDVATGRGGILGALAERAAWRGRAVGVDITPEMLAGAQAHTRAAGAAGRISLACGSGMQLPFAGDAFDAALCALATHHMTVPSLLAELRRVVRRGGQLLLADVTLAPLWFSPPGRVALNLLTRWFARGEGQARGDAEVDALTHILTPEQWRQQVSAAGFSIVEVVAVPARRRWYPPGILIIAQAQ